MRYNAVEEENTNTWKGEASSTWYDRCMTIRLHTLCLLPLIIDKATTLGFIDDAPLATEKLQISLQYNTALM